MSPYCSGISAAHPIEGLGGLLHRSGSLLRQVGAKCGQLHGVVVAAMRTDLIFLLTKLCRRFYIYWNKCYAVAADLRMVEACTSDMPILIGYGRDIQGWPVLAFGVEPGLNLWAGSAYKYVVVGNPAS